MPNSNKKNTVSLADIADRVMQTRGFLTDFPKEALEELATLQAPAAPRSPQRDMRDCLWVSIDNDDSEDLDQLTYAQDNKIYVAIADVDALVKRRSAIDRYAAHNTTSVYTPAKIFPMLPLKLSTNLTSLNEHCDRSALVVEITVDSQGAYTLSDVYPALVRNQAKLSYNGVASWLDEKNPSVPAPIADQVKFQESIARQIEAYRNRQGALTFSKVELRPIIQNGIAVELQETVYNRALGLIENFMIAANVAISHYFDQHKLPVLRRVVRTPKRWDRIVILAKERGESLPPTPDVAALRDFLLKQRRLHPAEFFDLSLAVIKLLGRGEYVLGTTSAPAPGHFDLALSEYAHTTAPNRRYPDLIMQRILKSHLYRETLPYQNEELSAIARYCTQKEDDAVKVERRMVKSAAAMVLSSQIGQIFPAVVTGVTEKGTWIRLFKPPVEGKLVHGFQGKDVGDRLQVKLIHTDVLNGYIDFANI